MQRLETKEVTFKDAKIEQQSAAPERRDSEKWSLGLENMTSAVASEEEHYLISLVLAPSTTLMDPP